MIFQDLHGHFFDQIEEVTEEGKWLWLWDGNRETEIESLNMAAQEQTTRTNAINAKIDTTQAKSECGLCDKVDGTVRHSVWMSYVGTKGV